MPVQVAGGHAFRSISTNVGSACALDTNYAAWCWGESKSCGGGLGLCRAAVVASVWRIVLSIVNKFVSAGRGASGELGTGSDESSDVPMQVAGGHSFQSISVGAGFSCALDTGGNAWCWGESKSRAVVGLCQANNAKQQRRLCTQGMAATTNLVTA